MNSITVNHLDEYSTTSDVQYHDTQENSYEEENDYTSESGSDIMKRYDEILNEIKNKFTIDTASRYATIMKDTLEPFKISPPKNEDDITMKITPVSLT